MVWWRQVVVVVVTTITTVTLLCFCGRRGVVVAVWEVYCCWS